MTNFKFLNLGLYLIIQVSNLTQSKILHKNYVLKTDYKSNFMFNIFLFLFSKLYFLETKIRTSFTVLIRAIDQTFLNTMKTRNTTIFKLPFYFYKKNLRYINRFFCGVFMCTTYMSIFNYFLIINIGGHLYSHQYYQ